MQNSRPRSLSRRLNFEDKYKWRVVSVAVLPFAVLASEGQLQTWQSELPGWCRPGLASLGSLNWHECNTDPRRHNAHDGGHCTDADRPTKNNTQGPFWGYNRANYAPRSRSQARAL